MLLHEALVELAVLPGKGLQLDLRLLIVEVRCFRLPGLSENNGAGVAIQIYHPTMTSMLYATYPDDGNSGVIKMVSW